VTALTRKLEQASWLKALGASEVVPYVDPGKGNAGLPGKARWAGAIDNLGGTTLAEILASTKPAGAVASIGQVADPALNTTTMPFAQRGIALLGVDTAYAGFAVREHAWARLAADLRPQHLAACTRVIEFGSLPQVFEELISGRAIGRTVVRIAGVEGKS
jgi:acrylyl-CoA reductase (NADPH)